MMRIDPSASRHNASACDRTASKSSSGTSVRRFSRAFPQLTDERPTATVSVSTSGAKVRIATRLSSTSTFSYGTENPAEKKTW